MKVKEVVQELQKRPQQKQHKYKAGRNYDIRSKTKIVRMQAGS